MEEGYFLCSESLIETLQPKERSAYLKRMITKVAVAKLDLERVVKLYNSLDEEQQQYIWLQEIEDGYIDISGYKFRKVNKQGFFDWMIDELGFVDVKNQCIIIHRVAVDLELNPIELFDKLAGKKKKP